MGRALYVGINKYNLAESRLSLCVADVELAREKFKKRGYTTEVVLLDEKATKIKILKELLKLFVSGDKNLLFYYSGHGSQVADWSGDEKDGFDECLVPADYDTMGMITDDDIRALMLLLPKDAKLMVVLDACHTGSCMDLAYNLYERGSGTSKYKMVLEPGYEKFSTSANVCMISGCQDAQTSQEAPEVKNGVLTHCFFTSLDKFSGLDGKKSKCCTWLQLISSVREEVKKMGYEQVPNLSSSKPLELSTKIFF